MIKSIIILIIMVLVNVALVFAILRLVKRTDDNLQKFFLDRTSRIFPVEEKSNDKNINADDKKEAVQKVEPHYVVNEIDKTSYKDNEFKDNYKNVKEEMNFNRADVILDVIDSTNEEEDKLAKAIKKINDDFDFETIYQLSTVSDNLQLSILNDVFDDYQRQFLNKYLIGLGTKKFDVVTFFNYVKEQAKLVDENFYIKTGSYEESYDDLGDNVVTVHDENIVEGIKVVHKNKMYDYSI